MGDAAGSWRQTSRLTEARRAQGTAGPPGQRRPLPATPGRRDRSCAGQRLGALSHPSGGAGAAAGRPLSPPAVSALRPHGPPPRQVPPVTAVAQWRVPPLHGASRQPRHGGRGPRGAAPRAGAEGGPPAPSAAGSGAPRGRKSSTERRSGRASGGGGKGEPRRRTGLQPHHGSVLELHGDPAARRCCSRSGPSVASVRHFESEGRGRRRRHRPEGAAAVTRPLRCAAPRRDRSPPLAAARARTAQAPPALRACSVAPSRSGLSGGEGKAGGAGGRAPCLGGGRAEEAGD